MEAEYRIRQVLEAIKSVTSSADGSDDALEFASLLYGRGLPEDLLLYTPEELALIAEKALVFLRERQPGRCKINIYNPTGRPRLDAVTIIEIANDDMPFLLDSALGILNERSMSIELVLHPILAVERELGGALVSFSDSATAPLRVPRESFIHIHVTRLNDEQEIASLHQELAGVFADARTVVLDWQPMRDRVHRLITDYQSNPPPVAVEDLSESIQFLQWLLDQHFTFLGVRDYLFSGGAGGDLKPAPSSGLGLLRSPDARVLRKDGDLVHVTAEVCQWLTESEPLIITKANVRSTVHRRTYLDYVGVKQFDGDGRIIGELRIVGLFTSSVYTRSARTIPIIRRKVAHVIEHTGLDMESHSGKALLHIIETFPRDELFQSDVETLGDMATGILQLEERPRTRLFVRKDKFNRFISAFAYIPRDRFNTDVRIRIGELLAAAYEGHVSAFYPSFPESALVRVHFIIGRQGGTPPSPDLSKLEAEAAEIVRTWEDRLVATMKQRLEPAQSRHLLQIYRQAFSAGYRDTYPPERAVEDILRMEELNDTGDIALNLYRTEKDAPDTLRLKLYHLGEPIALSDRLPILANMGFRAINERTYRVQRKSGGLVILHEVKLQASDHSNIDLDALRDPILQGFLAVWDQRAEDDLYNGLITRKGFAWRDAALLRSLSKYLWQAGVPFTNNYMAATLNKHAEIAAKLLRLFHVRFDPAKAQSSMGSPKEDPEVQELLRDIEAILADVPSLDEDRIIRRFVNLLLAMTRTNFFQRDASGKDRHTISFKIDSKRVDGLPEPKPFAEIFVYAPDMEGVHLRGGRIARGGIRWSDRPADFRTEVLGLAKAQNVKNAVIVPVGAKGGFVCKRMPADASREQIQAEGIRCYQLLISSLLDLTDNLTPNGVVHPPETIRHDVDDPYLVVAADKGTASFSDIANSLSVSRGFWLGDAFASGGSAGYDHKKMGITARGAWEAVKRHFREMDVDIQRQPFSVVGVGDMSGDVFGNGMLLSRQIRLVAAFDHRDIFIDPDPDKEASWSERARLFALPRSSWQDYDKALISKGGGVFPRQAKSIKLSDEMRALTGLQATVAAPSEIIGALLKARVDLLWFGGIGTYVRASDESDAEVGDRANDAIRIAASALSARVIGEGANLAVTQRARIEFAINGGRINTDAIDNSAGVNSSDYEVNIKIAMSAAEAAGKIDRPARNALLVDMTDQVAGLVLRNNYLQTLCLTIAQARNMEEMGFHLRLMRSLETRGLLDRNLENLPDDRVMKARQAQSQGLTRPELAVLVAYAKIVLFDEILESTVPDDPYLSRELYRYFPPELGQQMGPEIESHRLRREIISTMLANSMINRGGPGFLFRMQEEAGATVDLIAAAYAVARDSFGFVELNGLVDQLDAEIPTVLQTELYMELQLLLRLQTMWFLRNERLQGGLEALVQHYREGLRKVGQVLPKALPTETLKSWDDYVGRLVGAGVPEETALALAQLRFSYRGADIVAVATQSGADVAEVTAVFFRVGRELGIDTILTSTSKMSVSDYYDRLAINRTIDVIFAVHRDLVTEILAEYGADGWARWRESRLNAVQHVTTANAETLSSGELSLSRLTVMASLLQDLKSAANNDNERRGARS
ncbi:glutamate dehydrogenase [Rhodoligotrophos appendicifer]|uniref:NAD-glutamate dehydrogenase n=1 Tax=Rhodoligotrophos appendicifer TaxID=987056 RepID=UPI001184F0BF|nr:NAD-glutamate dehydrogenase [Rhodoligotrophos appendicifer]